MDEDLVYELVEGLGKYKFYRVDDTPISNKSLMASEYGDLDVGGVIVWSDQVENPQQVVQEVFDNQINGYGIFSQLPRETLMMAVLDRDGGETQLYYAGTNTKVLDALQGVLGSSIEGDLGDELLLSVEDVKEAISVAKTSEVMPNEEVSTTTTTTTTTEDAGTPFVNGRESFSIAFVLLFLLLSLLILVVEFISFIIDVFKERTSRRISEDRTTKDQESAVKELKGAPVEDQLIELEANVADHKSYAKNFRRVSRNDVIEISDLLQSIIDETLTLWIEAENPRHDPTVLEVLEVKYSDVLYRLNKLVGPEYWGDMLERPKYYKNPGVVERRKKVISAASYVLSDLVKETQSLIEVGDFDREVSIRVIRPEEEDENTDEKGFFSKPFFFIRY